MSYVKPSVQVTQTLLNPGGVAAVTPDLSGCIVGPLYNVVRADYSNAASEAKSEVKTDFVFHDSANVASNFVFELPGKVLGQILDESSVVYKVKKAYVKVNDFTANMRPDAFTDPENTATVTVDSGSANFPFTTVAPDGGISIKVGDLVRYVVKIDGSNVDRFTYVRSFDLVAGTVTFVNQIGSDTDNVSANLHVGVSIYRLFDELEIKFDETHPASYTDANTDYTISVDPLVSAFPDLDVNYYQISKVASFNVGYRALRTDKVHTILDISGSDIDAVNHSINGLGEISDLNPLALGVSLALANTTTSIKAMSIASDDLSGHVEAMNVLESDNTIYAIAPLTHDSSILAAYKQHVNSLSTPVEAAWRVLLVNTKIPTHKYMAGSASANASMYVRQVITEGGSRTLFIDPDVDFLTAGVVPTDIISVASFTLAEGDTLPTGSTPSDFIGLWEVSHVIDSNTLEVVSSNPSYVYHTTVTSQSNGQFVPYVLYRDYTISEQAHYVAEVSSTYGSNRVWNIMPDSITANVLGVAKSGLPGYYLAAAHAGLVAGSPVQQGFTNGTIAGIVDIDHSNYYFNREQLGTMAASGTCLYFQKVQAGIPICRHELTTDMTVLEYREQLKVKNWDFLSYYYYDKLKGFIGTWNITPETLNTIRATIIAASEYLMTLKLPKIGAPLLGYKIVTLEQNKVNKDRITVKIQISIVDPANYIDVDLEI